jgi:hypothetical protein
MLLMVAFLGLAVSEVVTVFRSGPDPQPTHEQMKQAVVSGVKEAMPEASFTGEDFDALVKDPESWFLLRTCGMTRDERESDSAGEEGIE